MAGPGAAVSRTTAIGTRTLTAERIPSANERFKQRWSRHVGWSTGAAVVAHAAMFAFSPLWVTVRQESEPTRWDGTALISLPSLQEAAGPIGTPAAPDPVVADESPGGSPEGREEGAVLTDVAPGELDLWEAIGERLRRQGALTPTIVESDRPSETLEGGSGATDEADEDPSIGGQVMTVDLPELPETGALDLDRLSNLRPELALAAPSAWVLIRNPVEVETFLRRGYLEGKLDAGAEGSVSVTLWIDRRGSVEWAEISESSGRRDLDEYALALFNEVASFKAAREDGVTVSRSVTLSVNFPW